MPLLGSVRRNGALLLQGKGRGGGGHVESVRMLLNRGGAVQKRLFSRPSGSYMYSNIWLPVRDYALIGGLFFALSPFEISQRFREEVRFVAESTLRLGKTVAVFGTIYSDYRWSLGRDGLAATTSTSSNDEAHEEVHERCAKRLQALFLSNGGIYIKIGQIMAEMAHMFPKAYSRYMMQLYDQACLSSLGEVQRVFRDEFGTDPLYVFDSFSEQPLASASLAQVHVAKLRGRKMAVKIHHHSVSRNAFMDMYALRLVVHAASWLAPNTQLFEWAAGAIENALIRELNFLQEMENCREAEDYMLNNPIPNVKFPVVYPRLTALSVLTMGYEEGVPLSDRQAMLAAGVSPHHVSKLVSQIFCQMLFVDGFVHCDPHPGNILVTWSNDEEGENNKKKEDTGNGKKRSPGIVVLDHALYRRLSPDFQAAHRCLWEGAFSGDVDKMISAAKRMLDPKESSHITEDQAQKLVEMVTNVPWKSLASESVHPRDRIALLEGGGSSSSSSSSSSSKGGEERGGATRMEEEPSMQVLEQGLRNILPECCDETASTDLFFTLKTLACLRASNRTIKVEENVAMVGIRPAIALKAVSEHWLVLLLSRWCDKETNNNNSSNSRRKLENGGGRAESLGRGVKSAKSLSLRQPWGQFVRKMASKIHLRLETMILWISFYWQSIGGGGRFAFATQHHI